MGAGAYHNHKVAFDYCKKITQKTGSNLWFVSRHLGLDQQQFFHACYCSMRLIDDYVDEVFLKQDQTQRQKQRQFSLDLLAQWRQFLPTASHKVQKVNPALSAKFFYYFPMQSWDALTFCLSSSNIGIGPWQRLADAMMDDIKEKPLQDWHDFEAYCMGATVAPAQVFLFVLGLTPQSSTGQFYVSNPQELLPKANAMAVFCYLIHIMRDLPKDVCDNDQILTVPRHVLQDLNFRPGVALIDQVEATKSLYQTLLEKTELYQKYVLEDLKFLEQKLPPLGHKILTLLITIYQKILENIQVNIPKLISGERIPTSKIRQDLRRAYDFDALR